MQRIAGLTTLQKDIAENIGVDATTVNRWANEGTRPSADHVVKFARRYETSVIESLIVAGYLSSSDVDNDVITVRDLSGLDVLDILDALRGRLTEVGAPAASGDLDDVSDAIDNSIVGAGNDLIQRRGKHA